MDKAIAEKITSVDEIKNHLISDEPGEPDGISRSSFEDRGDGYRVCTNKRELIFLINNHDQCCEEWGYLASENDLASFEGAQLLEVRLTDPQLKSIDVSNPEGEEFVDKRDVTFITFHTDRGPLQFCAYTEHNGYYGHSVYFKNGPAKWLDLTEEDD